MWVRWILSVACLAVALYHVAALITHSRAARDGAGGPYRAGGQRSYAPGYELSHLAMALGMAAMFSPFGDPVPPLVWSIVFGMAAAWFAACLLRAGTPADVASTSAAGAAHHHSGHHHLVANLAMLFMVVGGHQHGTGGEEAGGIATDGAVGGSGGAGHEGHLGGVGGGWIEGPIGAVLTVVLAGYFAVHTVRSLRVLFSAGTPGQRALSDAAGTGPVTVVVTRGAVTRTRVRAASHVVMGTAMTVMFGLML